MYLLIYYFLFHFSVLIFISPVYFPFPMFFLFSIIFHCLYFLLSFNTFSFSFLFPFSILYHCYFTISFSCLFSFLCLFPVSKIFHFLSFDFFPFPSISFLLLFPLRFLSLPLSSFPLQLFFFTFSDLQTGSGETCLEWPMAHCCRVQAGTSQEWRVTSLTQSCMRKSTLSLRTKSLQSSWRYPTCSPSPCTASTSMPVTTRSTAAVLQLLSSLEPNQQVSKTNKPNSCTSDYISLPAKYSNSSNLPLCLQHDFYLYLLSCSC